ncbi:MAG: CBS domain-containing protein [Actinobacteria bacterium]|nr:CBS domain-containing protein [Actinomycetota bacterium]
MSPRAACRLEMMGFEEVYDYAAGKSDWTATGLPTEGDYASVPRPGRVADPNLPTCSPQDLVSEVAGRPDVAAFGSCVVVSDDRIVVGRLKESDLSAGTGARADEVMEPGPTSVRYDEPLPDLVARMQARDVAEILVTTPGGELIGIMRRSDAERLLHELHAAHEH